MFDSDIILYEIEKIADIKRKDSIRKILSKAKYYIDLNDNILERAYKIQTIGIKSYDALHIASAEYGKAKMFLTTDDNLLKKIKNNRNNFNLRDENPLSWIIEVLK